MEAHSRPSRPVLWTWAIILVVIAIAAYLLQSPKPAPPPSPPAAPQASPSEAAAVTEGELRTVSAWGPRSTRVLTPFNVQPNGHSALWVVGAGSPKVKLELGGTALPTVVAPGGVTASVSPELLRTIAARPGDLPLYFVSPEGRRQQIGLFQVLK
jgi:hypothetical protein